MSIKLQSFNIRGERCSGTTYIQKLIETNLNIPYIPIGWKHGFYSPVNEYPNSPNTFLTIVIFRNVFDWLKSFYLQPHHIEGSLSGLWKRYHQPSFADFIKREIKQVDGNEQEMIHERHPIYLARPKNILELRRWKIENFLSLSNILPNVIYLRYEDLAEHPEKIISEINDKWFGVDYEFQNWNNYKDKDKKYTPKPYFTIPEEEMYFIVKNTDWNLEKNLGYLPPF